MTISGNLKWDKHITNICKKANSTLAVLRRNVRVPSKSIKSTAYSALIRPHVEYCSSVWDPYTKHLTNKIEMVQRRSARWVFDSYRTGLNATGSTEMIKQLNCPPPLETRRMVSRLCLMYKMANNLVLMPTRTLLIPYPYSTKSKPPHAFIPLDLYPPKLYFLNSFFPRTVAEWNGLPHSVAAAPSLEAFKSSVMTVVA